EFIPIAEDSGLILPIGDWVLNRACAEYARWNEAGYGETRFSVNLSSHQIGKGSLRDDIVRALGEHNIDPSALEVEVTEMSLIENQESVALTLRELTKRGIGVSLDDFGTGFSTLAYLKSFPIDSVKIDQSFVRDMLVDSDDASITEAIISIAEKFQLRVVAEGVELIEQRDFLSARGCHEMQGFLFSHAVPGDEFLKLLAAGPILR
ncbi:MAG: EAL domain-containing protein, partial [Myxococcota bacterium]|nr:EAL domain-containing protein [Myxococcota bacterium]